MIKNSFNCNFAKFQKLIFFLSFIQTFLRLLNAVDEGYFIALLCYFWNLFQQKCTHSFFFFLHFLCKKREERQCLYPVFLQCWFSPFEFNTRGHIKRNTNDRYRFSAYWLRSKCSICSYSFNQLYGTY